jgi:SAM-dependent methyltransferase
VSLSSEYTRQLAWRSWATAFDALPALRGQTVLDLGCAVGDQTAELTRRGARVVGIDANGELLQAARAKAILGAEFRQADLRALPDLGIAADGVWCSFTAAYFPDLASVLPSWTQNLRPGGFIALTEIDDLFGHEPLPLPTKAMLDAYARESLALGRYDFRCGRKLQGYLATAGFQISRVLALPDAELAFSGPALTEVLAAWNARFDRMNALADFCGTSFADVRRDFLAALERPDHRSTARVICCIGVKGTSSGSSA